MKILVCVSKTPETTARIAFNADGTAFVTDGVQYIMNPYDEWYALVRAIELKESNGGTVTAINVGPSSNDIILRKSLALGADDAIRIDASPQSAFFTAKQIAHFAKENGYDLVFCGKETIDYNGAEVGAMVAEEMDLPFISFATNLEYDGQTFTAKREIEGGSEIIEVKAPFVLSGAKGLAEQRIPKMKDIMMSKRKPLNVHQAIEIEDPVKIVKYALPEAKQGVKMLDPQDMDELVRLLTEEAKVL